MMVLNRSNCNGIVYIFIFISNKRNISLISSLKYDFIYSFDLGVKIVLKYEWNISVIYDIFRSISPQNKSKISLISSMQYSIVIIIII